MTDRPECKFEGCTRGRCLNGKDPVTGRQYYKSYCGVHSGRARRGADMFTPHKTKDTIKNRLLRYVTPGPENECWEWQGHRDEKGYGRLGLAGRSRGAHRLMYETYKGPIPKGLLVRHVCDNPPCVNPSHLLVGTKRDNAVDMAQRGRQHVQRLTADDVKAIREHFREFNPTFAELGKVFGVREAHVRNIVRGHVWKHAYPELIVKATPRKMLDLVERES